jgi:hypothetical protein
MRAKRVGVKPLTTGQKANAWHIASLMLEGSVYSAYKPSRLHDHVLEVIVPHLRAMAKRIRRRAKG